MDSFSNTEVVPAKIDLEGLGKVMNDWHNSFVESFKGTPVRIDDKLEGGQYYIAVSRELYVRLKDESSSKIPVGVPERP